MMNKDGISQKWVWTSDLKSPQSNGTEDSYMYTGAGGSPLAASNE